MPEYHAEPYLYLPALSHKSALVAWGAFYFRTNTRGKWKIVDDQDLKYVHPPRKDSIGALSAPYGPARVEIYEAATGLLAGTASTEVANYCWVSGLKADTEYMYRVFVKDEEWAMGERWDWSASERALIQVGNRYENRFRTNPDPATSAPLSFAVIGDFGVGVRKDLPTHRQQKVANALWKVTRAEDVRLILTTGDNIYAGSRLLGIPIGNTGDEDDDWFFTYFQPYRYVINQVPVYPSIGNHDADETEERDDRAQVEDNFYVKERLLGEEAAGRASFGPGLFYRFRFGADIEFICIDTSKEDFFKGRRLFEYPRHWQFLESAFPEDRSGALWRLPFGHHPPYSAGPQHRNTGSMQKLLPLFERSGVQAMFSGHEHNFQHSRADGIDFFVTGAAGQLRRTPPDRFLEAHTVSWATECHFLLARIEGNRMEVRAIAELSLPDDVPRDITRLDPAGSPVLDPIAVFKTKASDP
jgi:hypothetical protein